ncbi:hypothetical protein, partial [Parasphingorhabdus sp.]
YLAGDAYSLPVLQYEMTINRTLTQCEQGAGANKTDNVKFSVKVDAKSNFLQGETYRVDTRRLSAPTKITTLTLEHFENGNLKSINASAQDKTGEIVGNTVKIGLGLVALAAGVPPVSLIAAADPDGANKKTEWKKMSCTTQAKAALATVATKTGILKRANAEIKKTNKEILLYTNQASKGQLSDSDKAALLVLLKRLDSETVAQTSASKAVKTALSKISVETKILWPNSNSDTLSGDNQLTLEDQKKLMKLLTAVPGSRDKSESCPFDVLTVDKDKIRVPASVQADSAQTKLKECLVRDLDLKYAIERLFDKGAETVDGKSVEEVSGGPGGILIRPPEQGRLIVCQTHDGTCDSTTSKKLVKYTSPPEFIPQLGQLRLLPFENGPFENSAITVLLRENGLVEKTEYKAINASALDATTAALTVVDELTKLSQAKTAQDKADEADRLSRIEAAEKAENERLKRELENLKNIKEYADENSPDEPEKPTAHEAELALFDEQIAKKERKLRLKELDAALVN